MCKNLEIDALLVFALTKESEVSFKVFRELCEFLLKKHKDYVLSLDSESINLALDWYPDLFYKKDSSIVRTEEFKNYEKSDYIKDEFLSRLPKEVKNTAFPFPAHT